jgi:hypothetical protein
MSNADHSGNNDEESYHNIPSSKYFWISRKTDHGIAVHYGFFKAYTVFLVSLIGLSTAILCLTNWWQLAFIRFGTFFFVDYYYIGFPIVGITLAIWYIRRSVKEKKKLLSQIESARIRKYQDSVIEQNAKR